MHFIARLLDPHGNVVITRPMDREIPPAYVTLLDKVYFYGGAEGQYVNYRYVGEDEDAGSQTAKNA